MYVNMPMVFRCCFCAPLRYGLLIWGYLKLVTSIIVFGLVSLWLFVWTSWYTPGETLLVLLLLSALIGIIVDIIFNFVLIVGTHKKNVGLLNLYHRYGIAHCAIFLSVGTLWIAYAVMDDGKPLTDSDSVLYIVVLVCCIIFPLICHVYLFIVLSSEIYKLKAKDQITFVNPLTECESGSTEELSTVKVDVEN